MKFFILTFVVLAAFAAVGFAEPEPEPVKASRYRVAQIIEDDIKVAAQQGLDAYDQSEKDEMPVNDSSKKENASSGRLFMKRFLFKNMFGKNQNQPIIIPIFITRDNSSTDTDLTPTPTTPTTPINPTTDTLPTPITTNEPLTPTDTENPELNRIQLYGRGTSNENDKETQEEDDIVNEHTLDAALAAGADEYVVTNQEIKGTSDAKANSATARINLRRRGAKRGQVVNVHVPAGYRGYFRNGQLVILNNNKKTRPAKRRVIKRRTNNRRRINKNKNKRRRIA